MTLADLGQLGLDRVGHFDRVRVRLLGDGDGQSLVAIGPAEAGGRHELRADRPEIADGDGGGRCRAHGSAPPRRAGRPVRRGLAAATGFVNPTTRSLICASDVNVPMVETGTFEPSVAIWPDGRVRLFACRI